MTQQIPQWQKHINKVLAEDIIGVQPMHYQTLAEELKSTINEYFPVKNGEFHICWNSPAIPCPICNGQTDFLSEEEMTLD